MYGPETRYVIRRNGKRIGKHTVKFEQIDNTLTVKVESDIKVTVLKIPVYTFRYTATELWRDSTLRSVVATTTENGESNTVTFDASNSEQRSTFASNHWHPGVLESKHVFNTLTGNISDITLTKIGHEQLQTESSIISASHYRYTGDIEADVWYDDEHLWAKLQFKGEDASLITYLRD